MSNVIKSIIDRFRPVPTRGQGYFFDSRGEQFPGQWQRDMVPRGPDSILLFPYVFAALSLISGDIGKLPLKLMQKTSDGLWAEAENPAYSPVLRKPSKFMTRQDLIEAWILSVLIHGNAYILKLKDKRGVVRELRVLHPEKVTVLVSESSEVFYQLAADNLAGIGEELVTVPASEIIHHRINTFFHPLIGVSPIRAASMAAGLGLSIQENANDLFANSSRPGAILTAAGAISDETAEFLKTHFKERYSGRNGAGAIAVLADGLTFTPLPSIPATDAQAIETLGWTGETICAVLKIPKFKLQIGDLPSYDSVESLSAVYYSDALQALIEKAEALLGEGLNLPNNLAVEFDLSGLLRMDSASQIKTLSEAVGGGIFTINEARAAMQKPPVDSGNIIFRQQQEWPIEQLANRRGGPDNDNAAPDAEEVDKYFKIIDRIGKIRENARKTA